MSYSNPQLIARLFTPDNPVNDCPTWSLRLWDSSTTALPDITVATLGGPWDSALTWAVWTKITLPSPIARTMPEQWFHLLGFQAPQLVKIASNSWDEDWGRFDYKSSAMLPASIPGYDDPKA
jgi:hypothetical protein